MIAAEPSIRVGLLEHCAEVRGRFHGTYVLSGNHELSGAFSVRVDGVRLVVTDSGGRSMVGGTELRCEGA